MKRLMLLIVVIGGLAASPTATFAYAQSDKSPSQIINNVCTPQQTNNGLAGCGDDGTKLDAKSTTTSKESLITTIVNTLLYIAGIVAFIFVLVGGIKYITSTGDPRRTQTAKDTLLYAIIGLIVTLIAFPIAGFVIHRVG